MIKNFFFATGKGANPPAAGGGKASYSDNFDAYANATYLDAAPNWAAVYGGTTGAYVTQSAGNSKIQSGVAGNNCTMYIGTFANNQYSKALFEGSSTSNYIGLAVRCSSANGGTYYGWSGNTNDSFVVKVINGSASYPTAGTAPFVSGRTYELRVVGSELQFYDNNSLMTSMGTGGTGKFTDASIGSGNAGISGYSSTTNTIDLWEGGDL
jgi:hypothetical protein